MDPTSLETSISPDHHIESSLDNGLMLLEDPSTTNVETILPITNEDPLQVNTIPTPVTRTPSPLIQANLPTNVCLDESLAIIRPSTIIPSDDLLPSDVYEPQVLKSNSEEEQIPQDQCHQLISNEACYNDQLPIITKQVLTDAAWDRLLNSEMNNENCFLNDIPYNSEMTIENQELQEVNILPEITNIVAEENENSIARPFPVHTPRAVDTDLIEINRNQGINTMSVDFNDLSQLEIGLSLETKSLTDGGPASKLHSETQNIINNLIPNGESANNSSISPRKHILNGSDPEKEQEEIDLLVQCAFAEGYAKGQITPKLSTTTKNIAKKNKVASVKKETRRFTLSADPAHYCHICGRTGKIELVVCGNNRDKMCRKVICIKCLIKHEPDTVEHARQKDSNWLCPHCRHSCPPQARCSHYTKNNRKRRKKKDAVKLESAKCARGQNSEEFESAQNTDISNEPIKLHPASTERNTVRKISLQITSVPGINIVPRLSEFQTDWNKGWDELDTNTSKKVAEKAIELQLKHLMALCENVTPTAGNGDANGNVVFQDNEAVHM